MFLSTGENRYCRDRLIYFILQWILVFVPLWVAVLVSKRRASAAGMSVYVIDPIHIFSRAGGVGENIDGGAKKRVKVVED